MASTTSEPTRSRPNDPQVPPHPPAQPPELVRRLRALVLAFAALNAALYACFLPLWEGFDEPFHYAYVQELADGHVPAFGIAKVSREITASFQTVPLSRFLSPAAGASSFEQWFALSQQERQARAKISVPTTLRREPSSLTNYEAQQAPLAYALLVPFDLALSHIGLRLRILLLRLICSAAAVVLLWVGINRLSGLLNLNSVFRFAALSCVFASQMLWATVAHIGNDYLAVPLTVLFLAWLATAIQIGSSRNCLIFSAVFAAGLLTKAYFLAFAPVVILVVLVRKRPVYLLIPALAAGPWYVHNKLLYGSFSGTQQAVAGIGFFDALKVLPKIPWLTSTLAFLHWSLWTGNWSFLSFSKVTLDVELLLLAFGLALYFRFYRSISIPERWCLAACACFLGALIYQTGVTYIHTNGASLFAEPWYWQGMLCFLWLLVFRGFQLARFVGRAGALAAAVLTAWVAFVTYVAKLFPMYGGGFQRATIKAVWTWWTSHPTRDLNTVALAWPWMLYVLLVAFVSVLAIETAAISRALIKD